jgi:hypothetical protein
MFDSRHAPRYLRWFDLIALFSGLAVLIVLMLMLSGAFQSAEKARPVPKQDRALNEPVFFAEQDAW